MNEKGLTKNDSLCLKGVAILIMLFHHLFLERERYGAFPVSFWPLDESSVVAIANLCKICVSIFAFITGYGLLKSISRTPIDRNSIVKWNFKRLFKTMSGYYLIYILSFVITQCIDGHPFKTYKFSDSILRGIIYMITDFLGLSNLFSYPSLNSTWWYMSTAIIFVLLVPVFYIVSKKAGYLPVVSVIVILPRILKIGYPGGINPYTFILALVFGMIFADYNIFEKISNKAPKNKVIGSIASLLFWGITAGLICYAYTELDRNKAWEFKYAVTPVFVICFFRYCIVRIPVIKQILAFLGKHSMTIFLTHTFIRYNYLNDFVYSFSNFIKIYAVLFVLSIALAVVIDTAKQLIKFDRFVDKFTAFALNRIDSILK